MSNDARAFFLGAGASCAAGFPMTRDLIYGIAAAIHGSRERFSALAGYLASMFWFRARRRRAGSRVMGEHGWD
jgi:hypothetical protein